MKRTRVLLVLVMTSITFGCSTEPSGNPKLNLESRPLPVKSESSRETQSEAAENRRSDKQRVQEDVRRMLSAVYQGDVDTTLGFTHPKIVEMMGGAAKARSTAQATFSQIQSVNMKLESLEFPDAPTFLETDAHCFAIVPTKAIIIARGQRVESLNYQFGIQEKGATTWKYIEGSRVNQQNVRSLFPDFPSNYAFPQCYRKKL